MENEAKNRILIVEDKEENLELLQAVIESSGYKTVLARNGLEALEQLNKVSID
jgi:CheY-like chemotaxis protein